MKTNYKFLALSILALIVEPILFYQLQLLEFKAEENWHLVAKLLLFVILVICLGYIFIIGIATYIEWLGNITWIKSRKLVLNICLFPILLLGFIPIALIAYYSIFLERLRKAEIERNGKTVMAFIHFKDGQYYTQRHSGKGPRFTNHFSLIDKKGKIYNLEFKKEYDIFQPGDSIKVRYLESNPNFYLVLEEYPSNLDYSGM